MNHDDFNLTPGEPAPCPICDTAVTWRICQGCRHPGITMNCDCPCPSAWSEQQLTLFTDENPGLGIGWYCGRCQRGKRWRRAKEL